MQYRDRLVETSRFVVASALVLNRVFLVAVSLGLALSWLLADQFTALVQSSGEEIAGCALAAGMRWEMALGIVMALATERLLAALGQLVASARDGDPFIAANATRLRSIGWSLLVLQSLDIPAALLTRLVPSLGAAAPFDGVSMGGWMAVLMVFVLSRVFAAGAAMRDELAATV